MKKEYVKPETEVMLLHFQSFLLTATATGDYTNMPWGDEEEGNE